MIPVNVFQRVFQIKVGDSVGTCFTVDVDKKQYVITARHLSEGWNPNSTVQILYKSQWIDINLFLVGYGDGEVDIAVLAPPVQLSPTFDLPPTADGIMMGQDVYFLGFPYGWYGDVGAMNRNLPMPFVKKAILSNSLVLDNGEHVFFLDGHNNRGFSGGPVVLGEIGKNKFRVATVISGYQFVKEPVFVGDDPVPLVYRYNTGIIVSYDIKHAVDIIASNPVGFPLGD